MRLAPTTFERRATPGAIRLTLQKLEDLHWNIKLHDAAINCSQDVSTNEKDDDASSCKIQLRKISP
jgi:hypothetical protein